MKAAALQAPATILLAKLKLAHPTGQGSEPLHTAVAVATREPIPVERLGTQPVRQGADKIRAAPRPFKRSMDPAAPGKKAGGAAGPARPLLLCVAWVCHRL